jgi:ABC-type lipoprotein release transport system permease subunit
VRRTIITAIAIAMGISMYLIVDSMLLGASEESERNLMWYETASLRIHTAAWWEDRLFLPLDDAIEEPQRVQQKIHELGYTATARTRFASELILGWEEFGEGGYIPVTITAIGEDDGAVYRYGTTLVEGRFFTRGEMDSIVLGSWLAEDIGAVVGSHLTVSTRGKGGFFEAFDAQVVGLVNCPNPNVNRSLVMMDVDAADQYLAMDGAVTNIDILIPDRESLESVQRTLSEALSSIDSSLIVLTWKDLAQDYLAIASSKQGGSYLILFLIFIIAAVGISNTMLMAMYERSGEIAMMRAMGMEERSLWISFLLEASLIGLLGSAIGMLLAVAANLYMVDVGIDLSFLLRDMDMGFRIPSVMHGAWSLPSFIIAAIGGTALSTLAAVIPVRRALKNPITTALVRL